MKPKVMLPLLVLVTAVIGAAVLVATSEPIASRPAERVVRAVRVVPVVSRDVALDVVSQGTVAPRTESALIPEVSGRVVWTSPALVSGGYFEQGEPLLRIEREDYEVALEQARAALERAQGEYAHAQESLGRQTDLANTSATSEARLDDAERAARVTSASVREASAVQRRAERDLARTEIEAPFGGRVREESVDRGQFLTRGQPFATIYATDFVEVRLPIADAQLAYLDLPIFERRTLSEEDMPEVELSARFAGQEYRWQGRIVRTEGEIDARSRFVHVVARVGNDGLQAPLPVGLFVQARIRGRMARGVAVVPRSALHDGQVLVVDDEDRLRFRDVEVLRVEGDDAFLAGGLSDGERVCLSQLPAPVDGMKVRPVEVAGEGSS